MINSIAEFIEFAGIEMESEFISADAQWWQVTLYCGEKSLAVNWYAENGGSSEPDICSVFDALATGAWLYTQVKSFDDFCESYVFPEGTDLPAKYEQAKNETDAFREFLGESLFAIVMGKEAL